MKSTVEMLTGLMSCHAMTSNVEGVNKAMEVMKGYAEAEGLYTTVEDFNGRHAMFVATVPGKEVDFLLNTHLDVVVVPSDEMFTPKVDGDIIKGRGVSDDQGPAVCALKVMAALKGRASVGTIFTADEEHGGRTTGGMVDRGYKGRKIGLIIDGPAYGVAVAQKGIITLHLRAHGVSGHSSRPWNCQNAIDRLIDGYLKFRAEWPVVTETDQWHNTMAATVINGGNPESTNQIPNVAEMTLNIRYTTEEDYEKIIAKAKEVTGLDVETTPHHSQPMYTDENNPLIQKLMDEMRVAFPDHKIGTSRMNGATDARHLVKLGIPLGIIGLPGGDAHGPNEWQSLSGIEKYAELLTNFIVKA